VGLREFGGLATVPLQGPRGRGKRADRLRVNRL